MSFARYPSLQGRVVFITGGGSGIGAAMVEAFAAQGASRRLRGHIGGRIRGVGRRASATAAIRRCSFAATSWTSRRWARRSRRFAERLGPIGVLVNNAANDTRQEVDQVTEADWDRAMGLNLKHQFFAAQAVRPQMREIGGGSIINFSSVAWMVGAPRMAPYATAKAAIVGLTNSLAREFGADNIRVNAIAPGRRQRRTPTAAVGQRKRSQSDSSNASVSTACCCADEIARAALFLASVDSAMITKQCLVVDGGLR